MQKQCKQCNVQFTIPQEDLNFYSRLVVRTGDKRIEMPPPNFCFACRHQRRLAFRNEMNLYHRKCDKTGKQVISMYSPDKPYKIYDQAVWWSDDWDVKEYGKDFDFSRPFFDQYKELQLQVPRMSLNNINAENSEYCNLALGNKNSYLIFTADHNEDSAYLRFADRNYRCFDCDYTYDSTDCYDCMDIKKCNGCFYSHKCINSSGLFMCYNMIGSHDCIGCANLRNKQYYIFNESYDRDEYEKKRKEMALDSYAGFVAFKKRYLEFLAKQPRKYLEIVNCENSLGDYLSNCKNAYQCYNCIGLEDCRYMINCYDAKDCYDWDFVAYKSELCHEMGSSAYNMINCHFCNGCWENDSNLYYCELCLNTKDCFGCISLRHKQYCILNKQYSREEYEDLLPRVIEHMIKTASPRGERAGERGSGSASPSDAELINQEWGEFFPMELSTYAYNETVASEYFPLSKQNVEERGWRFYEDESEKIYKGPKIELPDRSADAREELCKDILVCESSGKSYKLIPNELKFCKMKGLPLPRISPKERHKIRMALRNSFALWERKCSKCAVALRTTYAPDRPEPVYCEKCYKEEVY